MKKRFLTLMGLLLSLPAFSQASTNSVTISVDGLVNTYNDSFDIAKNPIYPTHYQSTYFTWDNISTPGMLPARINGMFYEYQSNNRFIRLTDVFPDPSRREGMPLFFPTPITRDLHFQFAREPNTTYRIIVTQAYDLMTPNKFPLPLQTYGGTASFVAYSLNCNKQLSQEGVENVIACCKENPFHTKTPEMCEKMRDSPQYALKEVGTTAWKAYGGIDQINRSFNNERLSGEFVIKQDECDGNEFEVSLEAGIFQEIRIGDLEVMILQEK